MTLTTQLQPCRFETSTQQKKNLDFKFATTKYSRI